jgi:hypothetical protein
MKILVLEKDYSTFLALGQLLQCSGNDITVDLDDNMDLAIIDIHSISHGRLKRWCENNYDKVKIIITSTGSENKLIDIKYNHYLRKPFGIDNILDLICQK